MKQKEYPFFVYGSLRNGFYNAEKYMTGQVESRARAQLANMDLYHLDDEGYPAIVTGDGQVIGELVWLKDYENNLSRIDGLEEYFGEDHPDNLYHRLRLTVHNNDTEEDVDAFVYVFAKPLDNYKHTHIPSGDWANYMHEKDA